MSTHVTSARRDAPTPARLVARQLGRTMTILLVSALVTGANILLARSALGPSLTNAMAPAVAKPGGAAKPSAPPSAGQAEQGTGAPARPSRPDGAPGGGRNTPSLQRGLPDLLKYTGVMGGFTLAVVLVLRARRPRPRYRPEPAAPGSRRAEAGGTESV